MKFNRPSVPKGLPISAVITLILGIAAGPFINAVTTEEQRATNVLLSAIPFVLIFASIILFYIIIIWLVVTALSNQIPASVFQIVERIIIAGIVLGIFGMFQPWIFAAYKYGFLLLLFSTLAFILWSHITPKAAAQDNGEEAELAAIPELEAGRS
ncbi:MAG: hypothetical protein D6768_08830 [Chloroflexi bacterium]|nr:MAG: hypothetical protein D6768_08830 [Chloroflexota bacterium]